METLHSSAVPQRTCRTSSEKSKSWTHARRMLVVLLILTTQRTPPFPAVDATFCHQRRPRTIQTPVCQAQALSYKIAHWELLGLPTGASSMALDSTTPISAS